MTPRSFLSTLVRGYAVVIGAFVVALVIAIAFLLTQHASYRASSVVEVKVALPESATAKALAAAETYAAYRTVTDKALVTTDRVLEPVIARLGLRVGPRELADHVTPISAESTNLIEIRVDWPDARESAEIANAIADQIVDDSSARSTKVKVDLVRVTAARAASSPVVPNPAETLGLALLAALLVSSAWLFFRRIRRGPSSYTEA